LDKDHLTIQTAGEEKQIPYAKIDLVKLSKTTDAFKMTVKASEGGNLSITNKYYLPTGEFEDRSHQYTNFVKLFHHHLRHNHHSIFISKYNRGTLLIGSLLAAFFSVLLSFTGEFLGWQLPDPFFQAASFVTITAALIYFINRKKEFKRYSPDKIPTQFLP
jgi:hypothetical protein